MRQFENIDFQHLDDCKRALEQAAVEQGFAVVTRRSSRKDAELGYLRYAIVCVRGKGHASQSTGKRTVTSARTGCEWRGCLQYYKRRGAWRFNVKHDQHNHPPLSAEALAVTRRRRRTDAVVNQIMFMSELRPKVTAVEIANTVNRDHPGQYLTGKDVQNIRDQTRRKSSEVPGGAAAGSSQQQPVNRYVFICLYDTLLVLD